MTIGPILLGMVWALLSCLGRCFWHMFMKTKQAQRARAQCSGSKGRDFLRTFEKDKGRRMSTNTENDALFLQPHLLTKVSLIHFLEQRCMNLKHLQVMSKDNLVELFQRIALPLPQRNYRQNRRGKLMTKLQKKREGHTKKSQETHNSVSIGFGETSSAQSRVGLGIGDRLKPPPDAVNFERRKIRLNSGSNKSSDLDHIQIKRRKSDSENGLVDDEKQGTNREHKTNTSSLSVEEKPNGTAKVVLKRSLSASVKLNDTSSGQEPEKKKEKKLITWP